MSLPLQILIGLAILSLTVCIAVVALALVSMWLRERGDRNARRRARDLRDRREEERLARYEEHLAEQNGRPHTSAITMRATRRRD